MDINDKEKDFMIGLEALTRKTGIKIAGCGCCGSPLIMEAKITDNRSGYGFGYAEEVAWIDPSDDYGWENFSHSILK